MMWRKAVDFACPDVSGMRRGDEMSGRATADPNELGAHRPPMVTEPDTPLSLANRLRRCHFRAIAVRCPARPGEMASRLLRGRDSRTVASHRVDHPGAAAGESAR
ncbi:hypothetical protein [Nocardia niwae]|uniref:Uncharacterized protein n=1 Tax=Nocardia niwae TaxID=626084 RepID=A0ABV2X8E0_9NOCA